MAYKHWQSVNNAKTKNEALNIYQKKHEQMSKQEELIEQKKIEIQRRLEEKRRKETEDALQKLNESKSSKCSDSSRSKRSYHGSYKNKYRRDLSQEEEEVRKPTLPANIFNNDGSFLEQFQKISGVKVEIKKKKHYGNKHSSEHSNGGSKNVDDHITSNERSYKEDNYKDSEIHQLNERIEYIDKSAPEEMQKDLNVQHQVFDQFPQDQQNNNLLSQSHYNQHGMQSISLGLQQQGGDMMNQVHQPQQMMAQQHQMHQPMLQIQQQQPMFPPQGMPGPIPPPGHMPPINMNFSPQFNPMQCGMMLPPPMTPSNIPPPAPLNPGSIPSPSPLQPCSIPSPSPLQPYAIPPPSPLIPHSIPPPSPMVPHSIPPPSPLTPHSIPPPLPLIPQSIPPPNRRPPMFLGMAPPPPPPPQEVKSSTKSSNNIQHSLSVKNNVNTGGNRNVEENVRDLFDNDDYSSSDDEKNNYYSNSINKSSKQFGSDSESDIGQKSPRSDSDKESDAVYNPKEYSMSGLESDAGQESRTIPDTDTDTDGRRASLYNPIILEDTQTQFPSEIKDSSNNGDNAPTDQTREATIVPSLLGDAESCDGSDHNSLTWQHQVKPDPESVFNEVNDSKEFLIEEDTFIKKEVKTEEKVSAKFEVNYKDFVKQGFETNEVGTGIKSEEGSVRKRRRSRWADSDENVSVPLVIPPVTPGLPPDMPPMPPKRPPAIGLPGMALPTGLGGINKIIPPMPASVPTINVPGMSGAMISKVTRTDPALVAYAMKSFGHTNLTDAEWKKAEDHYKINLLYQDMMRKREELQRLEAAGRNKYEYDSDEEIEGGTWEHKVRNAEMEATQKWADELTEAAKGKHHIGDFLPPEELTRFMEKYEALKEGREPDLTDYKEFKLKEDNVGFQMLQKLGWTEGQGLGPDGAGIMDPVNKAVMRPENQGLGVDRPDDVDAEDDEYDAYRKRMMLAYRFRPNPMNNPRRPYY